MKIPKLRLSGAHEHNLKNVSLQLPHYKLITFTGVSGSGKSSLAFDTIFKEGQRRYVESLSSYARQFISQTEKPKVDHIEGLFPTVAINQKTVNRNPRSTVGTITEILDYLRLLFARLGTPNCPECGREVAPQTANEITQIMLDAVNEANKAADIDTIYILAPVIVNRRGEFRKELEEFLKKGFPRVRIDGEIKRLDENVKLERRKKHTVEIALDRIAPRSDSAKKNDALRARIADAVEKAIELTGGIVKLLSGGREQVFSTSHACPTCGISIPSLEPKMFSFNTPQGMCPDCKGLGVKEAVDMDLLVPDPAKTIRQGALAAMTTTGYLTYTRMNMESLDVMAREYGFDVDTPWKNLTDKQKDIILYGTGGKKVTRSFTWKRGDGTGSFSRSYREEYRGIIPEILEAYRERKSVVASRFMSNVTCDTCGGKRLRPEALSVTYRGKTIAEIASMSAEDALAFFNGKRMTPHEQEIGKLIFKELRERLGFLINVGLPYLTLDRGAATLSGGEAQRIRLATQVGSGLEGVLYVLDEPSIGLHHRDNMKLLNTLKHLRDRGNSVCVIEHDEMTMRCSDIVVDLGPGAGEHGGEIIGVCPAKKLEYTRRSITGKYLSGKLEIPVPETRRMPTNEKLIVKGAAEHNLKNIDVEIPLGLFVCVTGVSGSGKSTLVNDIIKRALANKLHRAKEKPGKHEKIIFGGFIKRVIEIDQSPIGRTPRSNPATYTNVFGYIRNLFAMTPEAKARGYRAGRFSFNVKGGRCEACSGNGSNLIEMQFLPSVEVECAVCNGMRFNSQTLEIRYKGKNIYDVLNMPVDEAEEFFRNIPHIHRIVKVMKDVGLGYVRLGQSSTTLSGGEAQRIKLAYYLAKPKMDKTLYILDEPTTGLHAHDVKMLLNVLNLLVDQGNSVVVVEHNPHVVKTADWIIDLGPEGGDKGGEVVAEGTPEHIAVSKNSFTGEMLREVFGKIHADIGGNGGSIIAKGDERNIFVKGAREHNLKNIDVKIPKNSLTVITGVSGSGKSSLAFDTVFTEGQRRYVESLSTYARQFLGRAGKPDVDSIEGISPSIAIDQKTITYNPRSTVATQTEIYDYLRLLFARLGKLHCPKCEKQVTAMTSEEIVRRISALEFDRVNIVAPYMKNIRSGLGDILYALRKEGFMRVILDGKERRLDDESTTGKKAETLNVIVDRVMLSNTPLKRLAESVELALKLGKGSVIVQPVEGKSLLFHCEAKCDECGIGLPIELTPRMFSFNNYTGFCPKCKGFGFTHEFDEKLVIPDESLSFSQRAFNPLIMSDYMEGSHLSSVFNAVGRIFGFDSNAPFNRLTPKQRNIILYGAKGMKFEVRRQVRNYRKTIDDRFTTEWEGLMNMIKRWYSTTKSRGMIWWLERYTIEKLCNDCHGERLNPIARNVRFMGKRLPEICSMSIRECGEFFNKINLPPRESEIAQEALREVRNRLSFMTDVGLDYLTLDRAAATLSGGESQRIRLATQIGSRLSGVLYVLDEPTIGLHPRDIDRLLKSLRGLRDLGNTLVVVEHDTQTIREADRIIDMGIGAGNNGGSVVVNGSCDMLKHSRSSVTGKYLSGRLRVPVPAVRRNNSKMLILRGAKHNNLKNIDVAFPIGTLICVTGVSGSGKSSLVIDTLYPALARKLHGANVENGRIDKIEGTEHLEKVIVIDQTAIGRSPKSNAATYTNAMTEIRQLFASLPESRKRGYLPGRFSFNRPQGVCSKCDGDGSIKVEMHFLPDVWITCDECGGRRYNTETLDVKYKGKSIANVLDMPAIEARELFKNVPSLRRILDMLCDVGLDYLTLGQSATTLSGGEAQRIKLATELCKRTSGKTLYLLDEPTTGLHFADVHKLVEVLHRLVDRGNTVVVIEHNPDVVKVADYVIDLGPEGGDKGGYIVATGTPEEIAATEKSYTGRFLKKVLAKN